MAGGFRLLAGASVSAVAPFPTAAHRTGLADLPHPALGRASQQGMHGCRGLSGPSRSRPCVSRLALPYSFFRRYSTNWVLASRQCPVSTSPQERTRTRAPSLHRHYPASSVPWAPPTSTRPEADHFKSPRLVAATHHLCGSHTLPQRPCLRMLTPLPRLERTSSSVGCSPAPRRPSPYGRRVGSSEKLSRPAQGSRAFRPAHLHPGCTEDFPGGFSRAIAQAQLLQWLPGEPTIPRTGLPPAGLRDPGGLSVICKLSSHQTSLRVALPGAYFSNSKWCGRGLHVSGRSTMVTPARRW